MEKETAAVRVTKPGPMPSEGFFDVLTAGRVGNVRSIAWH